MIKKLTSLLLLWSFTANAGLPPTTVQGQSDATPKTKFSFQVPYNQFTDLGGVKALVETGNKNLLPNASFENTSYASGWTITTVTGAVETTTVVDGKQSAKLTYTAQTGGISQSVTPSIQTNSVNYEASCKVNTTMTTIEVCGLTGGSNANCQAVPASGTWQTVTTNFVGPANGTTVGLKVDTTASGTGTVYVDDCYVGPARNLSQVSQAQSWGSLFLTGTAAGSNACTFLETSSSSENTFNALGNGASCNAWTASGNVTVPATNVFSIPLGNVGPGTYRIKIHAMMLSVGSGAQQCNGELTDGTTTVAMGGGAYTGTGGSEEWDGSFTYANSASPTITAKFSGSSTNTCGFYANVAGRNIQIDVDYFPSQQQQGYRADSTPASWSGYMNSTGGWTTTSATFADFAAGTGITLTERNNRNFGTVSAAGSSLPGISFTPPRAGRYLVCVNTAGVVNGANSWAMETVDGSGTVVNAAMLSVSPSTNVQNSVGGCGTYNISSLASATTIKLQGQTNGNTLSITNNGFTGVNKIEWSIVELDAPMPAPYLTGSVTSNTSGQERIERALVTNNGTTCAVTSQSGSWISSAVNSGTGQCTYTLAVGIFSGQPSCTCSNGLGANRGCNGNASSSTNVFSTTWVAAGASNTLENDAVQLICMGPH